MGLHSIAEDSSTIQYNCVNPNCRFHNCSNWEPWQQCKHHDTHEYVTIPAAVMRERMAGALPQEQLDKLGDTHFVQRVQVRVDGETRVIPIEHPDIKFSGPGIVALPICECGTQMFLKVDFTPDELAAPNITIAERDPSNPTIITRLYQHPMVARHQQLAAKLREMGKVYTPPGIVDAT